MKLNELKAAHAEHSQLCDQIAALQTFFQNNSQKLTVLEAEADLEDNAALDKITRLRVQLSLMPGRLSGMEEIRTASLVLLLSSTEEFVEKTLRPKIKAVRDAAVAKAEKALASVYSGERLARAVSESDAVVALDQISRGLQRESDPLLPLQYVTRRMLVLEQLANIEKSL